jgi:hypothetical protein
MRLFLATLLGVALLAAPSLGADGDSPDLNKSTNSGHWTTVTVNICDGIDNAEVGAGAWSCDELDTETIGLGRPARINMAFETATGCAAGTIVTLTASNVSQTATPAGRAFDLPAPDAIDTGGTESILFTAPSHRYYTAVITAVGACTDLDVRFELFFARQ